MYFLVIFLSFFGKKKNSNFTNRKYTFLVKLLNTLDITSESVGDRNLEIGAKDVNDDLMHIKTIFKTSYI